MWTRPSSVTSTPPRSSRRSYGHHSGPTASSNWRDGRASLVIVSGGARYPPTLGEFACSRGCGVKTCYGPCQRHVMVKCVDRRGVRSRLMPRRRYGASRAPSIRYSSRDKSFASPSHVKTILILKSSYNLSLQRRFHARCSEREEFTISCGWLARSVQ